MKATKKDIIKSINTKLSRMSKDDVIKVRDIITNLNSVNLNTDTQTKSKPKQKPYTIVTLIRLESGNTYAIKVQGYNAKVNKGIRYSMSNLYGAKFRPDKDKTLMGDKEYQCGWHVFPNKQSYEDFLEYQRDYSKQHKDITLLEINYTHLLNALGLKVMTATELFNIVNRFGNKITTKSIIQVNDDEYKLCGSKTTMQEVADYVKEMAYQTAKAQ